ncbi:MAG: hypothetical protein AAB323_00100 [Pseudomonadota bacterium]
MAQVVDKTSNSWALKDSKFNFTPPWFNQRGGQTNACYYCDAPAMKPILYLNSPSYPLCQNCYAPSIIDMVTPLQTLPVLKLYNTRVSKGFMSSYPLFRQIATVSGFSTVFATLCLFLRGGNSWAVSFLIGALSTGSALTAYAKSRRFLPATIPHDSVDAALRTLERTPDLLAAIIPDVGQRYNLYNAVKLLTKIHSASHDPAILELQKIESSCKVTLANAPMQDIFRFLEKESPSILSATLNEVGQAIADKVDLTLNDSTTKEDLAVIFAALSLAKKSITLTITATTTAPFSLADFTVPNTIQNLTLSHIGLIDLPHGFWSVTNSITLDGVNNLTVLPDLQAAGLPDQPLKLSILNSSLETLPRTITRRKIEVLDLTGCNQIKTLPANLATQIKDGTIQTLNLTGTSVYPAYQRNLVLNEQVRQLFGEYDPQKPHELFDHRSSVVTQVPQTLQPTACCNKSLSLVYTLILVLGITIPLGLLFMVFEQYFWQKNRRTMTDRSVFWASYLTGSLLVSLGIHESQIIAQSMPQSIPEKETDFNSGDTIFDVYNLLNRQGRELIDQGVYDWDRLWIQIFQQPDTYSSSVPEPLVEFVNMFMASLQGKFDGRLGKNFKRFINYMGGQSYLMRLSSMPFYNLVQTVEQDSYRFPVILDAVQDMRTTIGQTTAQYHAIVLNLEQIIETDMPVPDPDPQIMRALFAIIASGYHIDLSLNWIYNGKPQPLSFDMIPLASNLDRLSVTHAILNYVPEALWFVRHDLLLDHVTGLQNLPELPSSVPGLPLKLSLTHTSLDGLPSTLGKRPLTLLNLENSQLIRTLPHSVKDAIVANRVKHINVTGTSILASDKICTGDQLKQLLNQDVFEAAPIVATVDDMGQVCATPISPINPCNHWQSCDCADCHQKRSICCYLPGIEQTLKTISTVSCIALGGFALWKLKESHDHKQEDACLDQHKSIPKKTCHDNSCAMKPATTQISGFDFFKHSDFAHYANMLLGYVVQDVWLYEALQTFLESLAGMDSGQNWNCYELLYNISTRRIEFIEDANCTRPRCRILPDCVAIRYIPGCLCGNMISALNGQVLNLLLKDEIIFHLNLFETSVCLTDGTTINLRKQMVVLMYALGYTAPGQNPEDLYMSKSSICFVRRTC